MQLQNIINWKETVKQHEIEKPILGRSNKFIYMESDHDFQHMQ